MRIFDDIAGHGPRQTGQQTGRNGRRHDALGDIQAYWQALRHDRDLPFRAQIDPRGFERALSHAFLLERVAPGVARLRISGSRINDLLGLDGRGLPVTALLGETARDPFRRLLEDVFQGPAQARIGLYSPASAGRAALDAEMLLLPLRGHQGEVTGVFGGLETGRPAEPGRRRRFDLKSSFLRPLNAATGLRRQYPAAQALHGARPVRAAHLRLVASRPQPVPQPQTGRPSATPLYLVRDTPSS